VCFRRYDYVEIAVDIDVDIDVCLATVPKKAQ